MSAVVRVLHVIAYPLAAIMLIGWAIATFAFSGPGWVHLFLTLGVFLLIWRIVEGSTPAARQRRESPRRG